MAKAAAILDVDGTLVDSNYQHALAWFRAFRDHDIVLPIYRIHRHIGMGGDQLVEALAGDDVERRSGDAIREAERGHYWAMIDEVEAMADAPLLVRQLRERGMAVVLASSARPDEVERYVEQLGVGDLVDGWTSSEDVEQTKPHPDLIQAAVAKVEAESASMVGDSTWDCEAARRAGVPAVAVLTGGFSAAELMDAGAELVVESLTELLERLDETPLGRAQA